MQKELSVGTPDHYRTRIDELYREIRKHFHQMFIDIMSGNESEQFNSTAHDTLKNVETLRELLPVNGRPQWLEHLYVAISRWAGNDDKVTLNVEISKIRAAISPIRLGEASEQFDFDALFNKLRSESRIPQLFDKIIKNIDEMIKNKEIENHFVHEAMVRLREIVNSNKDGSYVSIMAVLSSSNFYGAAFWNIVSTNKYGKAVRDAFEETRKEMDGVKNDLMTKSLPRLIGPDTVKNLKKIPGNEQLALPSAESGDDVQDAEYTIKEAGLSKE